MKATKNITQPWGYEYNKRTHQYLPYDDPSPKSKKECNIPGYILAKMNPSKQPKSTNIFCPECHIECSFLGTCNCRDRLWGYKISGIFEK